MLTTVNMLESQQGKLIEIGVIFAKEQEIAVERIAVEIQLRQSGEV
jgi:hypothetical protein